MDTVYGHSNDPTFSQYVPQKNLNIIITITIMIINFKRLPNSASNSSAEIVDRRYEQGGGGTPKISTASVPV